MYDGAMRRVVDVCDDVMQMLVTNVVQRRHAMSMMVKLRRTAVSVMGECWRLYAGAMGSYACYVNVMGLCHVSTVTMQA